MQTHYVILFFVNVENYYCIVLFSQTFNPFSRNSIIVEYLIISVFYVRLRTDHNLILLKLLIHPLMIRFSTTQHVASVKCSAFNIVFLTSTRHLLSRPLNSYVLHSNVPFSLIEFLNRLIVSAGIMYF